MLIFKNDCLTKTNLKINKNLLYCNKDINCILKLNLQDKKIKNEYFIKI